MGVHGLKQLNYDVRTIILQNVRTAERPAMPQHFTKSQYKILCSLIIQKKIEKRFFDFILSGLFGLTDWKKLDYVSQTKIAVPNRTGRPVLTLPDCVICHL